MAAGRIDYATSKDWQDAMRNNSRYKMHEIIERLGLKANWSSNKRGKTNFDSPTVKNLVAAMSDIVSGLPKEHRELHAFLSAEGSLRDEVEGLLKKHGPEIWGRTGSREHLVDAGSSEVDSFYYPRDLYYEEEEDRTTIRVLLHWWMGQKAFNVIFARERMARERKKKEIARKAKAGFESPMEAASPMEVTQQMNLPDTVPQIHIVQHHATAGSTPMSNTSLTPPESRNSPAIQGQPFANPNAGGFTAINVKPSLSVNPPSSSLAVASNGLPQLGYTLSQPSSRQPSVELGDFVSNFLMDEDSPANSLGVSPIERRSTPGDARQASPAQRGLDRDTLRAFRRYIYVDEEGPECEEELLLRRLETAWRDVVRTSQKKQFGNTSLFPARDRAFLTWIELKRHLAELARVHKRWVEPSSSSHETGERIMQHRALMSASREVICSWEEITQGLEKVWAPNVSADELLKEAFMLVAGEDNPPELIWVAVNVEATISWLKANLERYDEQPGDAQDQLFYVRTDP